MRWTICLLLLVAFAVNVAPAQPAAGDVLVTSHTGDYLGVVNRTTGALSTLAALPGDPIPVIMAANNRDVLVGERPSPWSIWGVDPSGAVTTVAQGSDQGSITGMDWLQDGTVITCSSQFGTQGWLRSINLQNNSLTTLVNPQISHMRHTSINQDNGNALVPLWATSGSLVEIDLATQTVTTIYTGINTGSSVDPEPATGNFVVSEEPFSGNLKVITPSGSVLLTISTGSARAVKVEDSTGNFLVAMNSTGTNSSTVLEFDSMGTPVKTYGPFGSDGFAGIEIYGSRQVHGFGPATPGSAYTVGFSFPGLGGAQYVGALSLSQRPGIALQGSTVNLALDPIFIASVQGLFVSGFQGTLNALGSAAGSINLPGFLPQGLRFYCSAVAVSGSNITTGNTIGITIQ